MMKKIISFLLIGILSITMAACDTNSHEDKDIIDISIDTTNADVPVAM